MVRPQGELGVERESERERERERASTRARASTHWVRSQEHLSQRCCLSTGYIIPISQMKKLRPGGLYYPVHSQEGATSGSSPRLALALNSQPLLSRVS